MGLVESFSSNHFCRICRATLESPRNLTSEDPTLLRTKANYKKDVLKGNSSESGIKESCIFHQVDGFYLTEDISADVMHDLLQGVCIYDLQVIIKSVFETKNFSLYKN